MTELQLQRPWPWQSYNCSDHDHDRATTAATMTMTELQLQRWYRNVKCMLCISAVLIIIILGLLNYRKALFNCYWNFQEEILISLQVLDPTFTHIFIKNAQEYTIYRLYNWKIFWGGDLVSSPGPTNFSILNPEIKLRLSVHHSC